MYPNRLYRTIMEEKYIEIKGARVNNLKNINVTIPRNKLIVITGVSGSGKSSLAFDTLYAEGQRRYVESLSSYARQFLGRMSKPECDFIKGLPLRYMNTSVFCMRVSVAPFPLYQDRRLGNTLQKIY